ncbi:MAG: hypothetical protein ACFNXZ_02155 [Lautropia mirabilis]
MNKQFQIPPAEDLPLLSGMLSSQPRTLAALFLSAGLLAACGGSGGEGQSSAPASSSQQQETLVGTFIDAANEPAAGLDQPAEGHVPQYHADKVTKAVKVTATMPAILKAPSFGPAGETIRIGKPVTRVMGQYRNGEPVEGQRLYVGGKEVANGQQAAYTPTAADIGKQLIYRERVVNPRTREEIWAESAPVTVVSSTAPVARKAPTFGPAGRTIRVGEPVTRVTGEYDGGEAFEGFRLRNGKPVENGQQAAYTPVAADIGQVLVYGERVRNPRTGEVITVYSAEVTVVAAGDQAAKPVVTAPRPAPAAEQPAPATAPTMTVAPRFAPANQPLMVGVPVTRVSGTYQNGVAFEGFRLRNGVEISNGYAASYTPVEADVGQKIIYGERVRNPRTGEVKTFYSAEVTVVDAASPAQVTAPRISSNAQVKAGERLNAVAGSYRNGQTASRQWLRDGQPISGATQMSYTTVSADAGKKVSYSEVVRNPSNGKSATFHSTPVTVVAANSLEITTQPSLTTGTRDAVVGQTLVRKLGAYQNGYIMNAIWRVNGQDKGWGPEYTPSREDIGKSIVYTEEVRGSDGTVKEFTAPAVRVVASAGAPVTAPQQPTQAAKPGYPTASTMPRISIGTANAVVGQRLVRTMGSYTNGYVTNAIWKVNGEDKGWGPEYVPTSADVGKSLVYTEEVLGRSGDIVNFSAPAVKVVASASVARPTPAPAPAPAPVAQQNRGGTVNSVQEIVNDMKLYNEGELAGVDKGNGWASGPGYVIMGNIPRGTNTPSYWKPANTHFKSSATWNAVIPWLVVFDGVGNGATNTRVQMRNIKLYMKRKSTNRWEVIINQPISGEDYPKSLQGDQTTRADIRYEADGSRSLKPNGRNRVFHGWGSPINFDAWDLKALVTTVQARLVVDNPARPDDRSRAKFLIHVGADYYPETSTRVAATAPAYYFPGVGVSRAKYVRNEWRAFNFSTIDAGKPEPGGSISTQELINNPPPLE